MKHLLLFHLLTITYLLHCQASAILTTPPHEPQTAWPSSGVFIEPGQMATFTIPIEFPVDSAQIKAESERPKLEDFWILEAKPGGVYLGKNETVYARLGDVYSDKSIEIWRRKKGYFTKSLITCYASPDMTIRDGTCFFPVNCDCDVINFRGYDMVNYVPVPVDCDNAWTRPIKQLEPQKFLIIQK